MPRKINPAAKLKAQLPEEAQAELWEMLGPPEPLSYREALPIIEERWGVKSSAGALSEWYSWYGLQERMRQAEAVADQAKLEWIGQHPDATPEDMVRLGQMVFTASALETGDAKTFLALAQFGERKKAGERDSRRVTVLEQRAAQAEAAEKITGDETLTPEEKAARMKSLFGLG